MQAQQEQREMQMQMQMQMQQQQHMQAQQGQREMQQQQLPELPRPGAHTLASDRVASASGRAATHNRQTAVNTTNAYNVPLAGNGNQAPSYNEYDKDFTKL